MPYGTLKVDTITTSTQTVSVDQVISNGALANSTVTAGTGLTGGGAISGSPTVAADIASQNDAQTLASNTKLMTPLRVKDAVLASDSSWVSISTATTAAVNTRYLTDTSTAAFTLTLPAAPTAGQFVIIADAKNTFATNNLTVARNGNLIAAIADNLACNVNGATITLTWSGNASQGWIVK